MMEGVVQAGTANRGEGSRQADRRQDRHTNDEKDAWFIGLFAGLVVGIYMGLRQAAQSRKGATGGHLPRRSPRLS